MHIALIAHDAKKDLMVALARDFVPFLSRCHVMATGTTGSRLIVEAGIQVERLLSGPLGGDLQIGARLAEGLVDAVIFLRDPMTPQPHEPDINALVRACDVHNVPCATNLSTAVMLLEALVRRTALAMPCYRHPEPVATGGCDIPVEIVAAAGMAVRSAG